MKTIDEGRKGERRKGRKKGIHTHTHISATTTETQRINSRMASPVRLTF
jgi:hypothetical protein